MLCEYELFLILFPDWDRKECICQMDGYNCEIEITYVEEGGLEGRPLCLNKKPINSFGYLP